MAPHGFLTLRKDKKGGEPPRTNDRDPYKNRGGRSRPQRPEPSLIGAGGSRRSWFLPRPWVPRFSPRSALWPPHHRVRRVGVPICVATFEATASRLRALTGIT